MTRPDVDVPKVEAAQFAHAEAASVQQFENGIVTRAESEFDR